MKIISLALRLLLLASPMLAFAQNDTSIDSTLLRMIDLIDVVITAQYAPTHTKNALHQVRVIKAIDIQQQGQNNLAEVLSNQLNLNVSTDPILGNGLKIQGIGGENIQVMIDGVPVIGRVNGNIDLSQINLYNVERIEIIDGAMSAQYGSNAAGGVINLITKRSQLSNFSIKSQNQYEDIGIFNNALSTSLQFNNFFASLTASRNKNELAPTDSLRLTKEVVTASGDTYNTKVFPWNPKTQFGLDGTLRYCFTDSIMLMYQFRHFNEDLKSYGEIRRPQFKPYAFDDIFTTLRTDHSLHLESYLGSNFYLNATTAYNQYNRQKESQRLDIEPDTISLVDGAQDTTSFKTFLHRSSLSTVFPNAFNGQLGVEFLQETGTGKRIVDTTSTILNQSDLRTFALWGSIRYQFKKTLSLQGNLRFGHNSKYKHPLIPGALLSWRPQKNWNILANYAHGFRAPSLKELYFNFIDINHYIIGNTRLRPEHSKNASLTFIYTKAISSQHELSVNSKLFYNYIDNRIIIAEFAPFQFNYQNLDKFETHGLNLQLNYAWNKQLKIQFGLAYTRLYNYWSEEFSTDRFTGLYETQSQVSFQIPKINTQTVLSHRYIGRQIRFYQDAEEELRKGFIGDYHLLNGTLSKDFWEKRIFLAIGAKNILNVTNVPFSGEGNETHSEVGDTQLLNWGRSYFVRLNFNISGEK